MQAQLLSSWLSEAQTVTREVATQDRIARGNTRIIKMNPTLRVRSGGSEKSQKSCARTHAQLFLHPAPASDAQSAPTEPSRLAPSFRRLGGANHCRLSHRQPHPGANYSRAPSPPGTLSTPRLHANSGESHHAQHAAGTRGNSGIAATASIRPKPSRVPTVAKTIAPIA